LLSILRFTEDGVVIGELLSRGDARGVDCAEVTTLLATDFLLTDFGVFVEEFTKTGFLAESSGFSTFFGCGVVNAEGF
jgi:hypothetical protein